MASWIFCTFKNNIAIELISKVGVLAGFYSPNLSSAYRKAVLQHSVSVSISCILIVLVE